MSDLRRWLEEQKVAVSHVEFRKADDALALGSNTEVHPESKIGNVESTVTEEQRAQMDEAMQELNQELSENRAAMEDVRKHTLELEKKNPEMMDENPIESGMDKFKSVLGPQFTPAVEKVVNKLLVDRELSYWKAEQYRVENIHLKDRVVTDGKKARALAKEQMRKIATMTNLYEESSQKLRIMEQMSRSTIENFELSKSNSAAWEEQIEKLEKTIK